MEIFIAIVVLVALLGLIRLFKKSSEKEVPNSQGEKMSSCTDDLNEFPEDDNQDTEKQMEPEKMKGMGQDEEDTLNLMFDTLKILGCQPVKTDEGSITVGYQGEYFHIEVNGTSCRVWDPNWNSITVDDPELPKVREAVNAANFGFGPTVVLSAPNENNVMQFLSRYDIILNAECRDNHLFVKCVLDSFFYTKNNYRNYLQQFTGRQEDTSNKRRPVGFATDFSDSQTNK